ncbi:aldose epimerase family protein [Enterococcus hermanniensis]|uniref:Aldose 1-epimerase n=1 Tax=Enterococcus hermanniensis TaxID=249189 RepID=A0A1L8TPH5_9ENTE|nr:aldose epimerase family protein [Enterococcus hermanniensis]OJG46078.1 aldose 1-epimerase [Enterococcus hermanniensis]
MHITEKDFGHGYRLITIENESGFHLSVTDLGARIVSLGNARELVLGFDSATEYLEKDPYIGAMVGRIAGRIENGHFSLEERNYQVTTDPLTGHCLHGGKPGFESKKWAYHIEENKDTTSVIFSTISPDGEHGFPGNLTIEVRYSLTEENIWELTTKAISDQTTLFNPTNHVYFNLTGDVTKPIDQHQLWLNSSNYAPLRSDSIPTGEKVTVTDTAFDFQVAKTLDRVFSSNFEQKVLFNGIDHPFFLNSSNLQELAAKLSSPDGLIELEVFTDASCIVIFTANFGENTPEMHGKNLADHGGITFETQTAPGAEQFSTFGSISLLANQPYETTTRFKITMKEVD